MKAIKIVLLMVFLLSATSLAQNYSLDRYVIAAGGGALSSTSYSGNATLGQTAVGESSSPSYTVGSGFWYGAGGAVGGCDYVVGDVNGSGNYNGLDVTYGVAFLKGGNAPQCDPCLSCPGWNYCGDVNGSCNYNGLDITYGVAYLKGGSAPVPCGDCPPAGGITTAQRKPGKSD